MEWRQRYWAGIRAFNGCSRGWAGGRDYVSVGCGEDEDSDAG